MDTPEYYMLNKIIETIKNYFEINEIEAFYIYFVILKDKIKQDNRNISDIFIQQGNLYLSYIDTKIITETKVITEELYKSEQNIFINRPLRYFTTEGTIWYNEYKKYKSRFRSKF